MTRSDLDGVSFLRVFGAEELKCYCGISLVSIIKGCPCTVYTHTKKKQGHSGTLRDLGTLWHMLWVLAFACFSAPVAPELYCCNNFISSLSFLQTSLWHQTLAAGPVPNQFYVPFLLRFHFPGAQILKWNLRLNGLEARKWCGKRELLWKVTLHKYKYSAQIQIHDK